MEITLYSTHCPKCKVIEMKLKAAHLEYKEINDVQAMLDLGFKTAPILKVDDQYLEFAAANKFLNEAKANGIH